MDGQCGTCKWWDDKGNTIFGTCLLHTTEDTPVEKPKALLLLHMVGPGSQDDDYFIHNRVRVATAADFGCIQWKVKASASGGAGVHPDD